MAAVFRAITTIWRAGSARRGRVREMVVSEIKGKKDEPVPSFPISVFAMASSFLLVFPLAIPCTLTIA